MPIPRSNQVDQHENCKLVWPEIYTLIIKMPIPRSNQVDQHENCKLVWPEIYTLLQC